MSATEGYYACIDCDYPAEGSEEDCVHCDGVVVWIWLQ